MSIKVGTMATIYYRISLKYIQVLNAKNNSLSIVLRCLFLVSLLITDDIAVCKKFSKMSSMGL